MKKVVLTVAAVAFAAIAAQAQSVGAEVRLADSALRGALTQEKKAHASRNMSKVECAVERQVAEQVKKQADTAQVAQQAARSQQNQTGAQKEEGGVKQWVKAILLGGRFPGESEKDYRDRVVAQSQPASLPFK